MVVVRLSQQEQPHHCHGTSEIIAPDGKTLIISEFADTSSEEGAGSVMAVDTERWAGWAYTW